MKTYISALLIAGSISLVSTAAVGQSQIRVSCQGEAEASFENGSWSPDSILNPSNRPFEVILNYNRPIYIGAFMGGCGSYGCGSQFQAQYEIRYMGGQKLLIHEIRLSRKQYAQLGTHLFVTNRYGREAELECAFFR